MVQTIFRPGLFANRVAVVTGGGSGIGLAIARTLGVLGAKVAIGSRKPERLAAAKQALAADGVDVLTVPVDIREVDQVARFADTILGELGAIDILVNNAGGQFPTAAETLTAKGWDAVIRNNLNGTFYMTHAVATKSMIPKKHGRIINIIANIARGFPGMVHTGAARAGVENMTKTLAVEWAQFDVRVNAVAPGIIQSSGIAQYPPELVEAGVARTPQKRIGTVEEIAHSIVYLASPAAAFVTGITLQIDGGASLWGDTWLIPDRNPR